MIHLGAGMVLFLAAAPQAATISPMNVPAVGPGTLCPAGTTGAGIIGEDGVKAKVGVIGEDGLKARTGIVGEEGVKSPRDTASAAGIIGEDGVKTKAGVIGEDGVKAKVGIVGEEGVKGSRPGKAGAATFQGGCQMPAPK